MQIEGVTKILLHSQSDVIEHIKMLQQLSNSNIPSRALARTCLVEIFKTISGGVEND